MNDKILKVLRELEAIPGKDKLYWNVPVSTASFLNLIVRFMKAERVLEIGTSNGYSGIHIAEALIETGGMLYTVESHEGRHAIAGTNFEKAGVNGHVKLIKGHAPEVLGEVLGEASAPNELNSQLDLVFLDATKSEYKSYLEAILPLLRVGGLVVADNCTSHKKEMKEFLDYVEEREDLQSVVLPMDNGVMLCLKLL